MNYFTHFLELKEKQSSFVVVFNLVSMISWLQQVDMNEITTVDFR